MKVCSDCKLEKEPSEFHRSKNNKDGLTYICKPCAVLRAKNWAESNSERSKAIKAEWYDRNKERLVAERAAKPKKAKPVRTPEELEEARRSRKAWGLEYRAAHKLERSEYNRKWRIANRERYLKTKSRAQKNRKHRLRAGGGSVSTSEWHEVLEEYDHSCAYCGAVGMDLEIEHFFPLSKGGKHERSNVLPACGHCNLLKRNFEPEVWIPKFDRTKFHPSLELLIETRTKDGKFKPA